MSESEKCAIWVDVKSKTFDGVDSETLCVKQGNAVKKILIGYDYWGWDYGNANKHDEKKLIAESNREKISKLLFGVEFGK